MWYICTSNLTINMASYRITSCKFLTFHAGRLLMIRWVSWPDTISTCQPAHQILFQEVRSHVVWKSLLLSDMGTYCSALKKDCCPFNLILSTWGLRLKRRCFGKGNLDYRKKKQVLTLAVLCRRAWLYRLSLRKALSHTSWTSSRFLRSLASAPSSVL